MFLSVRCQLSSVIPSSSNHPLSPTPYDRLINSGWNSSFALSRRSDIISSRSLFPLSLCLSLFFSYYFLTPFFFPLSFSLCHVSPELLFFSRWRIGESRGKLLAREASREVPVLDFLYFFFWDRRGARRGSVSRRRLIIPLRQYVFNTPLIGRLPV